MAQDVDLRCRCGDVSGTLREVSPKTINRAVCYCDDCQAFLYWLDRADLLDRQGGTDLVQVAPSSVTLHRGQDRVRGMRLSPKGMFRFYASCCKTPLGNTVKPTVLPFIGVAVGAFPKAEILDAAAGPPRARVLGKFAVGPNPDSSALKMAAMIAHVGGRILAWKLGGKAWPHPYFDRESGQPRPPLEILSREERDALRPKCGPRPIA